MADWAGFGNTWRGRPLELSEVPWPDWWSLFGPSAAANELWYAAKLHPKNYGAKPEVPTVNVGVGMAVNVMTEEKRAQFIEEKRRAIEFQRAQGNRV